MLVTSPLKMQNASITDLSFSNKLRQTINFPFDDAAWLRRNLEVTRGFLSTLGPPQGEWREGQPMWESVGPQPIIDFLREYQMDPSNSQVRTDPIIRYIERQVALDELVEWVVAVMGQRRSEERLGGPIDLGIRDAGGQVILVNPLERTRIRDQATFKAITSQHDQEVGLTPEQIAGARDAAGTYGENIRSVRPPTQGALLVYPISRFSGHQREGLDEESGRVPIYEDPASGEDVVGIAFVFPNSRSAGSREYLTGTVEGPEE
jgi:hypothetical protein